MKTINVVGAAIIAPPYVLAFRRGQNTSMPGKWEFPGGKVEPGESREAALARELREELQLHVSVGAVLGHGKAEVMPGTFVHLDVFEVIAESRDLDYALTDHDAAKWLHADELASIDWADADIPVLRALKTRLLA